VNKNNNHESPEFSYDRNDKTGLTRLAIRFGLGESELDEISKQNYDVLHLLYGDYTSMGELNLEKIRFQKLQLAQCKKQNLNWISRLVNVNVLSVDQPVGADFDFLPLVNLKNIAVPYNTSVLSLLRSNIELQSLTISKFNDTLDVISPEIKRSLKHVGITSGKLTSLDGIEKFINLESLLLHNLRGLVKISSLSECKSLTSLNIYSCKSIEYKDTLPLLNGLRKLFFENQILDSLEYLPSDSLEHLILGESTSIEDNNVSSLIDFPKLKSVVFKKKRAYQFSAIEINDRLSGNEL